MNNSSFLLLLGSKVSSKRCVVLLRRSEFKLAKQKYTYIYFAAYASQLPNIWPVVEYKDSSPATQHAGECERYAILAQQL